MKGDDYWWPLIKNPETVINEIIEGMNSLGLPWLNLFATRENILDKIWDVAGNFVNDNTLTIYVKRIRAKLGENDVIKTIKGIGYRVEK